MSEVFNYFLFPLFCLVTGIYNLYQYKHKPEKFVIFMLVILSFVHVVNVFVGIVSLILIIYRKMES